MRKSTFFYVGVSVGVLLIGTVAQAAFIVQVDTDGSTAGNTVTLNPRVTFGNGTTNHGGGSVHATAVGLAVGNSIFGGNAPVADQYIFTYKPGNVADVDNYLPAAGTALGNGNLASGLTGGVSGTYNVYAVWPSTTNISDNGATPTSYAAASDGPTVSVGINQDEDTNGAVVGGVWMLIGTVQLTAGNTYTVTQTAPNSSFVSMRAEAIMWERVPEPTTLGLLGMGSLLLVRRRRTA
jgi:hypothetical protein